MTFIAADVNELALSIFGVVVAVTLFVTYLASKRVANATDFWAAGRGLTGVQNGFAIAGDYMSAASFLGIAGLIFLFGFDGFLYSVGFLVAFLTVLFLLGERMRNAGKYTIADVLSFRMNQKPARAAAALGTLAVAGFYLIAQMVGAGVLIQALVGIDFALSVIITGAFMIIYIVAGGMLATSWVQIIKAVRLMTAATVLTPFVLGKLSWNPINLFPAIIAAVAFATILAVVAGLVISASGAVAHDVWSNIVRHGRDSEREEVWVAKIAAVAIGAIAITIAVIGGEGLNVSFMVGLAFAVAASAIFPALLLALTWRQFNTSGAVTGVLFGTLSSIALVIISPTVWPGPDSEGGALGFYDLANPGIISIPLGFIGCWLGTVLARERRAERTFDELYVRAETGLGAEVGTGLTLTGRREGARTAAVTTTIPPV